MKRNPFGLRFDDQAQTKDRPYGLSNNQGLYMPLSIEIRQGLSAHLAVAQFAEENSDLVVMATHGHSRLEKMLIGSTTEKVFKNLKIPIITLKPKFAQRQIERIPAE